MACAVEGCDNQRVIARGWCEVHYRRWLRHGDPLGGGPTPAPHGSHMRWIRSHVDHTSDECLIWPFYSSKTGYARAAVDGKPQSVHRVMCRLAHGEPPSETYQAAHLCGKGHLGCVNPRHLAWKTPAENQADRLIHGTSARGEQNGRAVITEDQVREIYALKGKKYQYEIAAEFGISKAQVSRIHRRESWPSVLDEFADMAISDARLARSLARHERSYARPV